MIVDAHAHVYRNPPGHHVAHPVDDYLATLREHGVSAAVLVQPSFFGLDHSEVLAAIARAPAMLAGVGTVTDSLTRDEMLRLHDGGVRGIRVNFFRGAREDLSSAAWRSVLAMLEAQGWHLELNARDEDMAGVLGLVRGLSIPMTVDHIGRPDPDKGASGPGFRALLDAARTQAIHLKLTSPFRTSMTSARECVAAWLDQVGPHRLLWGSDCPWVEMKPAPTYADTLSWLDDCVPESARAAVLGGNAVALYGFAGGGARGC